MQETTYQLENTQIIDQITSTNCNEQLDTDKSYTHVKSSQATESGLIEIKWKSINPIQKKRSHQNVHLE